MKQIFLTFALFFAVYLVSVVALNLIPKPAPIEQMPPTPQIQMQNPQASPSANDGIPLPLSPDL